jgi:hypothetical protein
MVALKAISLLNKAKLGMGGIPGMIVGTVVLEFVSKFAEDFARKQFPSITKYTDSTLVSNAPFLGSVDGRDAVVLAPSILKLVSAVRGGLKSSSLIQAAVGYGTKVVMRQSGLNPLPEAKEPAQAQRKMFSYQLPSRS